MRQEDVGRPAALVTSLQNEKIKAVRALAMRKIRRETGLFVAEGAALLISARERGIHAERLLLGRGWEDAEPVRALVAWSRTCGSEVLEVSDGVLAKVAGKDNPQTAIGVFRQRWASLPEPAALAPDAVWLVLEQVRDPGNLGSIVRTVDAVGGAGVILAGASCDPYARECVRATMGSIFAVPLIRVSRQEFLAWRRGGSGDVVGTHLNARLDFRSAIYKTPLLLLLGSEGPGLSDAFAESCTKLVKIPMVGRLDSLNLSVAAALALYQIRGEHLRL